MQRNGLNYLKKVFGRKPSPEEFMAGKACGFDLKQIPVYRRECPAEEVAPDRDQWLNQLKKWKNVDPASSSVRAWLQHFEGNL